MASIKQNVLKRWDTGPAGVRICCIKFVQKIIQVQTPGVIADPRVRKTQLNIRWRVSTNSHIQRPEQNEISLAIVPRDHPMIPPSKLEPEASGLLDRLLNVFQEDHRYVNPKCRRKSHPPNAILSVMLYWSTPP